MGGRWAFIAAVLCGALVPAQANATFPGQDGRIAYSLQKDDAPYGSDIATIQPDGSGFQQLTNLPGLASNPAWSPDGTRLAFTQEDQGKIFLYVMAADGSNQRAITELNVVYDGGQASPSFSRDGERIAYSDRYAIWTIRPDGTDKERVYSSPDVVESSRGYGLLYPVYSPDGRRIAFVRNSPDPGDYGVWTMRTDGTGLRHILERPRPYRELDYRPDGKQIVFLLGSREPYRMRPDGTHVRKFRPISQRHLSIRPTYSPSGRFVATTRMAFDVGLTESCGDLVTIALDGSGEQLVTSNCQGYRGPTAWKPDWQPLPG